MRTSVTRTIRHGQKRFGCRRLFTRDGRYLFNFEIESPGFPIPTKDYKVTYFSDPDGDYEIWAAAVRHVSGKTIYACFLLNVWPYGTKLSRRVREL